MPIATAIAIAGIGLAGYGLFSGSQNAKKAAGIQKQILAQQQNIEEEKRKAMELDASRRTLETFRNVQRTKSVAQANAVAQGANSSSGLLGGYAQAQGEGNYGLLGIGQNLQIGRSIFDFNKQITGLKQQLADVNASMQVDQGITSLGSAMISNAGGMGKIFSGFGTANMGGGGGMPNSAMTSGYGIY